MTSHEPKPPATPDTVSHLNGHANGASVADEGINDLVDAQGSEPADEPISPPPPQIVDLIDACVRFVLSRYGVRLDGTQDTLSLLDHYVREARAEVAKSEQALGLVERAVGAYLGEVLRQTFGGEWFAEGDVSGWRLDMTHVFLTFNPVGMAREALTLEAAEGWHAHLALDAEDRSELERRLTRLGEVDEEEYYAPTTRFEVVEIAIDVLRARMVERGLGDVRFTPEDYRQR